MNDYSFFSAPQLKRDPLGGSLNSHLAAPPGGFRRADFEAIVKEHDRILARRYWMLPVMLGPIFIGLPAWLAIVKAASKTSEPPNFLGLVVLLGISAVSSAAYLVMATRLARRVGLTCSACGFAFITGRRHGPHSVVEVLQTGKCPGCGKQLLNEVEVGPRHDPQGERYAPLWAIGTLVVIIVVCVASYLITAALWGWYHGRASP